MDRDQFALVESTRGALDHAEVRLDALWDNRSRLSVTAGIRLVEVRARVRAALELLDGIEDV